MINTYKTTAEIILYLYFFSEDVLLFVFALIKADQKGNSQTILKITLLTTDVLTNIKEDMLMMRISFTIDFFMIRIFQSISTSTTFNKH